MLQNTRHIGFLIFPGFPMACLTSAIEPMRAANEIADETAFSWSLISEDGTPVTASANVVFQPDKALGTDLDLDIMFLLSGPHDSYTSPQKSKGTLRHLARHGCAIGAVSGGIFPLAASGLMQDRLTSVHWVYKSAFLSKYPDLHTSDDVIVMDRGRMTASGASAMFDLMLHLIKERLGAAIMTEVACWFQHPLVRSEGVSQSIPALKSDALTKDTPPPVAKAIALFSQNLEEPLTIAQVAEQVAVSPRQLERVFQQAVQQSPLQYYRGLRMQAARQRVIYSSESLTEIAHSVGYASSSTMARHYRAAYGVLPQEERRQTNRFRVEGNRPVPST